MRASHLNCARSVVAGLAGWVMFAVCHSSAAAHEFWIAPERYAPALGERVSASLKVGQMMNGADFPYLSGSFHSFTITTREGTVRATGDEGDIPALTYDAQTPGLHVIGYHAVTLRLTYETFEEFTEYLDYEGLGAVAELHRSRGLPENGFTEAYTRYAKALVQVDSAQPMDVDPALGFRLELVARANPYARGVEILPVTLTWEGKPVAGAQISVFRKDGEVTRGTLTSNAQGRADIPLREPGEYLLNAVYMEPDNSTDVVWQSHWASLTFEIGGK